MSKHKKTVVMVANTGFTITNFRRELVQKFIDMKYDVVVVCPHECTLTVEGNITDEIHELGATHFPVFLSRKGINPFKDIKTFVQLYSMFRSVKPDIVLNYTIKPVIYSSIAAKLAGVKNICSTITGLGYIFTGTSMIKRVLLQVVKMLYRISLRSNTVVFFQNNDDLTLFSDLRLLRNVKTKIVNGSGVNLEVFHPSDENSAPNSFIMIGRILRDKGVLEFIEAAKSIKNIHPDTTFTLLGPLDNNPASFTREDISQWENAGIIQYIPAQHDVRPHLAKSEVFVLPSYREGTPRSVLEAMAMGMPIITTDAPGCKETTVDQKNGFLVAPKNAEQLSEAMLRFIEDSELKHKMGEESLQIAREKYDVHSVNNNIICELST